jgi:hypothetical protein
VTRFGDRAVARAGGALAALGMGTALVVPTTATTIAGFGLAGLGIATLIPAAMHAADAVPGLPNGAWLSITGFIGRLSLLLSPPAVGIAADAYGLRAALTVVPVAGLLVVFAAAALRPRPRPAPGGPGYRATAA